MSFLLSSRRLTFEVGAPISFLNEKDRRIKGRVLEAIDDNTYVVEEVGAPPQVVWTYSVTMDDKPKLGWDW